jgi:hypothetical protein
MNLTTPRSLNRSIQPRIRPARWHANLSLMLACVCTAFLAFSATRAEAQSIVNGSGLSFGAFLAGSGGTVAVGTSNNRSKSGGVFLLSQGGSAASAQFTVSGTPGAAYAISLPANGTVALTGPGADMALNGFLSSPTPLGTLSGGGSQMLSIGATLSVGSNQTPGSYSGSFNVTVTYE